jgi:hypothetical protein
MGAKHRMTDLPKRRRPRIDPRARPRMSRSTLIADVAAVSVLCAASLAALVVSAVGPEKTSDTGTVTIQGQPRASQPVSQEGTLIAVSADSLTARSVNGYSQTYRVNPNTTLIADGGSQLAAATSRFKVNDEVEIVGTIQGGTALATAVADRGVGHGDGPPMDYVESQPVTGAPGKAWPLDWVG